MGAGGSAQTTPHLEHPRKPAPTRVVVVAAAGAGTGSGSILDSTVPGLRHPIADSAPSASAEPGVGAGSVIEANVNASVPDGNAVSAKPLLENAVVPGSIAVSADPTLEVGWKTDDTEVEGEVRIEASAFKRDEKPQVIYGSFMAHSPHPHAVRTLPLPRHTCATRP